MGITLQNNYTQLDNTAYTKTENAPSLRTGVSDDGNNVTRSNAGKVGAALSPSADNAKQPLFTNMASKSAAETALRAAGLAVNSSNITIIESMMREGLSVSKESIWDMMKNVSRFPNADPVNIVQLTKLSIPLSDLTIAQFSNYKNAENSISADVAQMADEMTTVFTDNIMSDSSVSSDILSLVDTQRMAMFDMPPQEVDLIALREAIDSFAAKESAEEVIVSPDGESVAIPSETVDDMSKSQNDVVRNTLLQNSAVAEEGAQTQDKESSISSFLKNAISYIKDAGADLSLANLLSGTSSAHQEAEEFSSLLKYPEGYFIDSESVSFTAEEKQVLFNQILETAFEENVEVPQGPLSMGDVIEFARNLYNNSKLNADNASQHNALKSLLSSEPFGRIVSEGIKAPFSIAPNETSQKGNIEELYHRMIRQTDEVLDILHAAGKGDSPAAAAANNIGDNLMFMNQVNSMLAYIQLPLKMAGEDAHGELMVYTNKKNLMKNDGNVTALIHLDMEHLGPMDVYLAMQNHENLKTHFYMQNDDLMDFMEKNMHILTKRLSDKGYRTDVTVTKKNDSPVTDEGFPNNLPDALLKDESGMVSSRVSRLSFDVRA